MAGLHFFGFIDLLFPPPPDKLNSETDLTRLYSLEEKNKQKKNFHVTIIKIKKLLNLFIYSFKEELSSCAILTFEILLPPVPTRLINFELLL